MNNKTARLLKKACLPSGMVMSKVKRFYNGTSHRNKWKAKEAARGIIACRLLIKSGADQDKSIQRAKSRNEDLLARAIMAKS